MAGSPDKIVALRTLACMLGSFRGLALLALCAIAVSAAAAEVTPLRSGWKIQSGCSVQAGGATISRSDFKPEGWIAATVPSTVLAAQVAAGEFKDPDYGMNLRDIPGTTYNIGTNFSSQPMAPDSPYNPAKCSWWYRAKFAIAATEKSKTRWLHFDGINYRANIWINGQQVADSKQVQGAFRTFDLNVSKYVTAGKVNVLAVETFAPTPDDLAMTWVDWSPMPPDKEMGLWQPVSLVTTGPVAVSSPTVETHFTDASLNEADLSVYGLLRNASEKPVHGLLTATLEGFKIEQAVDIGPGEEKDVAFTSDQFAKLRVENPRIWWPWQMGAQNLETLKMSFAVGGQVSDEVSARYGIREVTAEKIDRSTQGDNFVPAKPEGPMPPPPPPPPPGTRRAPGAPLPPQETFVMYRVNGKPILIRGGGWASDMLLRGDHEKLVAQFNIVRDMDLNTIRSEGKMETEDFFNIADEKGVLIMIGWCCCDRWERWTAWTPENQEVAVQSLHSQMMRLRNHPSVFVWLNGSDHPPTAEVETLYLNEEAKSHWPNPTLSSATARRTAPTGESGVKMNGPYDYVVPSYWLTDTKRGGAWGFSTEIGPGPAIPTLDSMSKFLPDKDIWPHGAAFNFHAGGGGYKDVHNFDRAMDNIYGPAKDAMDYDRVAQAMAYDGERAMFEGYGRNKYNSTGVIQWMLNNAWPSVIWHLYDYYLGTGGGYFGTKKACEPLHIQYSYDDHSIWVVNSTYAAASDLTASAAVYDVHLKKLFDDKATVQIAADGAKSVISVPDIVFTADPAVHFVQLELKNKAGAVVSKNFYWLPSTLSTYALVQRDNPPIEKFEDMTALRLLPKAKIDSSVRVVGNKAEVLLHNPSSTLAFQVAVSTNAAEGLKDTPILWSDNYIELMPGESATLSASLPSHLTSRPIFRLSGWNIETQTLHAVNEKVQ